MLGFDNMDFEDSLHSHNFNSVIFSIPMVIWEVHWKKEVGLCSQCTYPACVGCLVFDYSYFGGVNVSKHCFYWENTVLGCLRFLISLVSLEHVLGLHWAPICLSTRWWLKQSLKTLWISRILCLKHICGYFKGSKLVWNWTQEGIW